MKTQNSRKTSVSSRLLSTTALTAASLIVMAIPALADDPSHSWVLDTEAGSFSTDISTPNVTNIKLDTSRAVGVGNATIYEGHTVNVDGRLFAVRDNRVDPTLILGHLNSNGKIVIIDGNGVFFGPNSRVDVAGLVATTGDISTDELMNGDRWNVGNFGDGAIDISNGAQITVADAGIAAFVSPTIRNAGVINAKLGKVAFAAGEKVTLDLYGDNLVEIAVDDKLADAIIEHTGTIDAEGGVVQMTAAAAKEAVDNIINVKGLVTVASATQKGGKIILSGGNQGAVNVEGTLDASGATGGGEINVTGEGVILSETSELTADGTDNGNGGKIINYGNSYAIMSGRASAKGGANGGNGGFVELSAKEAVGFNGSVDTSAANGTIGRFLIDPENINLGDFSASTTNLGLLADIIANGHLNELKIDDQALANSLKNTDVDLWATNKIYTSSDFDISTWETRLFGLLLDSGLTKGDLGLSAKTIDIKHNITLGKGDLIIQDTKAGDSFLGFGLIDAPSDITVETVNLDAQILARSTKGGAATLAGSDRIEGVADTVNVISNKASINQGIEFAEAGKTVNVGAGTYTEQVNIGKNLNLIGAGQGSTIIQAPSTLGTVFTPVGYPNPIKAVVYAHDASDISISDLTVDGNNAGNANNRFAGIGYHNAGGSVQDTEIKNIQNSPFDGVQGGYGVFAWNDVGTNTLDVKNNTITNFQKNGVMLGGTGLSSTVSGNTITGHGATNLIAQNGIVIMNGANALVDDNTISGIGYSTQTWLAGSILVTNAGDSTSVTNNTISGTGYDVGVFIDNTDSVVISGNTIDGSADGIDVQDSDGAVITGNEIENSVYDGIWIEGGVGLTIDGINTITNSGDDGIDIIDTTGVVSIKDNVIDGTTGGHESNGIAIEGTDGVTISGNTIKNTDWNNINVDGATGTQIKFNVLDNSVLASGIGIWGGSNNTTVAGNTIKNSNYGIWNQGGTLDVRNNFIHDNTVAGLYTEGNANVTVYDNSFAGNALNLINNTGNLINASFNWWGSADESTVAGSISGLALVDISPYQGQGIDTDGDATNGYQGELHDNLYVTDAGAQQTGLIQEAIDAAAAGETVKVNAGAYTENLVINKALKLTGLTGATLTAASAGNLITVSAANVNIDPFTFNGGGIATNGIYATASDNLIVDGNTFLNFTQDAIHVESSSHIDLKGNIIHDVGGDGIEVVGGTGNKVSGNFIGFTDAGVTPDSDDNIGGDGINTGNGDTIEISNNTITNTWASGIAVHYTGDATVQGNVITNTNFLGIYGQSANGIKVLDNQITNAGTNAGAYKAEYGSGIGVESANGVTITGNTVDTATHDGISVVDFGINNGGGTTGNVTVDNNEVTGTGRNGIVVGSGAVSVSDNTVSAFGTNGILVSASNGADILNNDIDGTGLAGTTGIRVEGSSDVQIGDDDVTKWVQTGKFKWQGKFVTTYYGNDIDDVTTGISIVGGDNNHIVNNDADSVDYGIVLSGSTNAEVRDNDLNGNSITGISVLAGSNGANVYSNILNHFGTGIIVDNSSDVTIDDNTLTDVLDGIAADVANGLTVTNNGITGRGAAGTGVKVTNSDDVEIGDYSVTGFFFTTLHDEGNDIAGFATGVDADHVTNLSIVLNDIDGDNTGTGIRVTNSNGAKIGGAAAGSFFGFPVTHELGNDVKDFGTGIYVAGSDDVNVEYNTVHNIGGDGIYVLGGDRAYIFENDITDVDGDGIDVNDNDDVRVHDNNVDGTGDHGIEVSDSRNADIADNDIYDAGNDGINVENSRYADIYGNYIEWAYNDGIDLDDSAYVDITDNHVHGTDNGNGIEASDSYSVEITGNRVHYTGENGIDVDGSARAVVADNEIHDTDGHGINVDDSYRVSITGNDLWDLGGNGITVDDSNSADVSNNDIDGAGNDGIHITDSRNTDIADNDITGVSRDGIYVRNSDNASITGNDIYAQGGSWSFWSTNWGQQGAGRDGIHVEYSDNADITGNDITADAGYGFFPIGQEGAGRHGIYVLGGSGADIFWNDVTGDGAVNSAGEDGIHVVNNDNADIIGNDVEHTGADGIYAWNVDNGDIRGNEVRDAGEDGIDVAYSANVDVVGNHVHGAADNGIEVTDSFNADISWNRVHYTGNDGIYADNIAYGDVRNNNVHDAGDDGIDVRGSAFVDVNDNTVRDTAGDGIQVRGSYGADVNGNTVENAGDDGIDVENSDHSTIDGNTVDTTVGNGIELDDSSYVTISANTVNNAGQNGIQVVGGTHNTADSNIVLGSGWNGIEFDNSDNFLILSNTTSNNGQDGILINGSSFGDVTSNTANLNLGDGIEVRDATNVDVYGNTANNNSQTGLRLLNVDQITAIGNGFGFNGQYGVFAEGAYNGSIQVLSNVINASPVGARFESGAVDISNLGLPNVIIGTGGTVGLQFDEVGTPGSLSLAGNSIGATTFSGFLPVGSFYVRFEDGTLLDTVTGAPIVIDGLNANFDGLIPASQGGFLTLAQLEFLEDRIYDADDALRNGRGQLFVGTIPTAEDLGGLDDVEDFFNRYGTPGDGTSGFSVTVRGLPNVTAAGLNALTPAAGSAGPAGLNAITPAAGDETGGTAPQDIEPEAGGEDVSCWSDAVSAGGTTTFNFGGSFEDSLAGAGKCSSGDI